MQGDLWIFSNEITVLQWDNPLTYKCYSSRQNGSSIFLGKILSALGNACPDLSHFEFVWCLLSSYDQHCHWEFCPSLTILSCFYEISNCTRKFIISKVVELCEFFNKMFSGLIGYIFQKWYVTDYLIRNENFSANQLCSSVLWLTEHNRLICDHVYFIQKPRHMWLASLQIHWACIMFVIWWINSFSGW